MIPLAPGPEFDRIRRILSRLGRDARAIGDDCAIIPAAPGDLVISTDLSLEGRHFRRDWLALEEIGWRAAAGALSDLAAEGAAAVGVTVSLGMPSSATDDDAATLMGGVADAVHAAGGVVLGGDLTAADCWLLDVTVIGRAGRPVTRRGAEPGDVLWVSGTLGGARAALMAWLGGRTPEPGSRRAFARPEPRIALGQALALEGARAMIDLSDGLGGDAAHLAAASGVHLDLGLDVLPLGPGVAAEAALAAQPPEVFAGQGGEDYELLVAMPPAFGRADAERLGALTGTPLTAIGTVAAGSGVTSRLAGRVVALPGFDHFR